MSVEELTAVQRAQAEIARWANHERLVQEIEDLEHSLVVDQAWLITLLRQVQEELDLAGRDVIGLCTAAAALVEKLEQ